MPSFGDSIFLFALALLLFGPKKLPVLARELGKWVGEFRRASNEFKMQMEEELRQSEQADRQKQIAAMEAAAPLAPSLEDPAHPHLPAATEDPALEAKPLQSEDPDHLFEERHPEPEAKDPRISSESATTPADPLPIAVSGDLSIMPPSTGLPTSRGHGGPLGGLLDSIPESGQIPTAAPDTAVAVATESEAHVR